MIPFIAIIYQRACRAFYWPEHELYKTQLQTQSRSFTTGQLRNKSNIPLRFDLFSRFFFSLKLKSNRRRSQEERDFYLQTFRRLWNIQLKACCCCSVDAAAGKHSRLKRGGEERVCLRCMCASWNNKKVPHHSLLRLKPLLIIVRTQSQMREEEEEDEVPHPLRPGRAPPGKTKAADAGANSHSLRGELF